ncbi:hypothetical protein Tco_0755974 [Tanacetum coccineum]
MKECLGIHCENQITDFNLAKDIRIENIAINLDSSSDNNNSDSYRTSQISTSEEIDYDSPELPKSLLKWYHYFSDEYKDNGRFWGSKSGSHASEASSKAKVEACGSKAKLQASTKTLIGKSPGRGSLEVDKIIDISSNSLDDKRWAAKKASAPVFYGPSTPGLLDAYGCDTIEEYLEWNYFRTDSECTGTWKTQTRETQTRIAFQGYVLGLPNVTTWDEIEKKMGARKSKTCADKAKGKRKVSCGS